MDDAAVVVEGRGPEWVLRQRNRCIVRGSGWALAVPAAVLLHRVVPGLAWYGPIAMVVCVLLGALVEAWRWPRTGPEDAPPAMVALTVGITVGVIVCTIDVGANHAVVYPIGEVVILAAWFLTIATIARLRGGPQGA